MSFDPPTVPILPRDCATCRYCCHEKNPGQIISMLVCREGPPTYVLIPGPTGLQGLFTFPTVAEKQWCFRWESHPPPALII